jgi:hypothetical protein
MNAPRILPVAAGIGYSVAWIAGLSVASASTGVRSSGAEIIKGYAGHRTGATLQFLLTEVVAALCLAVVVVAVAAAGRRAGALRPARWLLVAGLAATAISVGQGALGAHLVNSVVPAGDARLAATLTGLVNRADGVKMFVLAVLVCAGFGLVRPGVLPRWLGYGGLAVAVPLVASGIGYLLLVNALSLAAYASLPLLLIWVTGAGVVVRPADR